MSDDAVSRRKAEHLELALREEAEGPAASTLFEEVSLVHNALPELALSEVSAASWLCGKVLRVPIVITGMTGGTEEAGELNRALAGAAEARGLAFGVGSQRVMRGEPLRAASFRVRDVAPSVLLLGNLGVVQARALGPDGCRELVEAIGADGLCVHLNPAQELVQPEGDRDFRGAEEALGRLAEAFGDRLIVKETGAGISPAVGRRLLSLGVKTVDVAGAGGTSWTRIEALRARERARGENRGHDPDFASASDPEGPADARRNRVMSPVFAEVGEALAGWGIPTAAAVASVVRVGGLSVIASGGIRDGVDAARALALGAEAVGVARPLLAAWKRGGRAAVEQALDALEQGLRAAMLLCGARDLAALRAAPRVLGPRLRAWLEALS